MTDIIYTLNRTKLSKRIVARLATVPADHVAVWNMAPRKPVNSMFLVQAGWIIGFLRVLRVCTLDECTVRCFRTGKRRLVMDARRLLTIGPMRRLDPIEHDGFRGFRYFNLINYARELYDVPRIKAVAS